MLTGEFEQLIHREGKHAKHQVRHDFTRTAYPNKTRSELIFQPALDALDHGAQLEALLLGRRERKPFARVVCGRSAPLIITT